MPDTTAPESKSMDELVALCKRRGFVYPASEIYGGINGFWDYGPLGTALKNNIRDHWWHHMVTAPPLGPPELTDGQPVEIVGVDTAIIQNPKVWEASGHVGGFSDPMVDCTESKRRYRADHLWTRRAIFSDKSEISFTIAVDSSETESAFAQWLEKRRPSNLKSAFTKEMWSRLSDHGGYTPLDKPFLELDEDERKKTIGPDATQPGTLTQPRQFNLMFESHAGAIKDDDNKVYLRPETAQGIFLNYKNVLDTMRVKLPFGIAQIGKSFRNEVTPRNFIFRSREFEQMEMQWFCPPEDSLKWYEFWKAERMEWWLSLGINPDNLIFRDHDDDELAHYSKACVDVEYKYPFTAPGYGELEGVAHRGDFDLKAHSKSNNRNSNAQLDYFDQELQVRLQNEGVSSEEIKRRSRYTPHVIEPASGLTRAVLVLLCEAFTPDPSRPSGVVMKFKPRFAPIKAGIFPLVNKDGLPEVARKLYMQLRGKYACDYDAKQSIGKRYARMDEVGTPFCFTIDNDTLTDGSVTVRHRDTQAQERVNLSQVEAFLAQHLAE